MRLVTALPSSGAFVMVDPTHVAVLGAPAALLFARICWRSESTGCWKATRRELVTETGLSPDVIRTAVRLLREQEWVSSERASADDATLVWRPILPGHADMGNLPGGCGESPHVQEVGDFPFSSTETEDVTTDTPAAAAAGNGAPAIMVIPDSYQDALIPAVSTVPVLPASAETGPPKTAQTLVARWCDGYRQTNGHDAPGPLMKRVAGHMKTLAKACGESHTDWVAAYGAAFDAGKDGRWDPVGYMSRRQRQARTTNAFVSPELGGPGAAAVSMMGSLLNTTPGQLTAGQS